MGNLDLFRPVVPEAAFHPNFRHVLRDYPEADRAVLLEWAEGFEDRDGKFVSEFQRTFNTAFWELYLFAVTKELGFHVDFRFTAPDFVITNFRNEFCIEATTAHNARGKTAEWEVPWPRLRPNPETVLEEATIRLANALTGKYSKYQES
jgi:hypothetical protein